MDGECGHGPEDQGGAGCQQPRLDREQQGSPHLGILPGEAEPLQRDTGNWPALNRRDIEGIDDHQPDRDEEEEQNPDCPQPERDPQPATFHGYIASKAPRRRAPSRYSAITPTGTIARAAAKGMLCAIPTLLYTTLPMKVDPAPPTSNGVT